MGQEGSQKEQRGFGRMQTAETAKFSYVAFQTPFELYGA